jgi:uncharacterized protein (DUF362 family)
MNPKTYHVQAVHCDPLASDEEVYAALRRATAPLTRSWERLRAAKRIWIKFNQDWMREPRMFEGQRQEHVSDAVARATLRLLRENTSAELLCAEVSYFQAYSDPKPAHTTWILPVLQEFDVRYVDWNQPPVVKTSVPGGGLMFERYFLPEGIGEAIARGEDALISVQKMKSHAFMGITLCLKNLFGLMPTEPLGRHRNYYHHLVRMPYMLVDIGRIFDPALNIIDALTGQAGREWGGEPRITHTLVAGDQVIATDAVGATLMGHDPASDWLTPPFHRDRNALLVAAQHGWGTVDLAQIDYHSEVQPPLAEFHNENTDAPERVINWRRTTAEQALYYRDHRQEFLDQYAGQHILLQRNQVVMHNTTGKLDISRRLLSGQYPEDAIWFKYADPEEAEGEHFEVYEQTLEQIRRSA